MLEAGVLPYESRSKGTLPGLSLLRHLFISGIDRGTGCLVGTRSQGPVIPIGQRFFMPCNFISTSVTQPSLQVNVCSRPSATESGKVPIRYDLICLILCCINLIKRVLRTQAPT